MSEFETKV